MMLTVNGWHGMKENHKLKGGNVAEEKEKKNELVKVSDYSVLNPEVDFRKAMEVNMGSQNLDVQDLEKILLPSKGAVTWQYETIDGDVTTKDITGIVIHFIDRRMYYSKPFSETGGGERPDCSSGDMITGVGNPGGKCEDCKFEKFESSDTGLGSACKPERILFIAMGNDLLPTVIKIPVTSIKAVAKYFLRLGSKGIPFYSIETILTLEKEKSKSGIPYSKVVINVGKKLDEKMVINIEKYRDDIIKHLNKNANDI